MYSFEDGQGRKVIIPEDVHLALDTIEDIVSGEITDYIVYLDETAYDISKEVYDAIKNKYNR